MGFLDRFKKQKEKEVEEKSSAVIENKSATKKEEKKEEVKKVSKERKEKVDRPSRAVPENLSKVLVRPVVTEKSAHLSSVGQYVFEVLVGANRSEVAAAVKAVYGVEPVKVLTQNLRREPVRFGRFRGQRKARKKAIVCLPKGKTINVHEGV
jgi:large subunit ribosomal protein L23